MTFPIQLEGNLKVGADSGSAVDVSAEVTKFIIRGTRAVVEVPGTLANSTISRRAGSQAYELEIGYFPNVTSEGVLWAKLWDELDTDTGTLYFEGTLYPGAVGVDNPKFSGEFIVTGTVAGGEVGSLVQDSQTFPLVGRPSKVTA